MTLLAQWRFFRRLLPSPRSPQAPPLRGSQSVSQPLFMEPELPSPTESEANLRADEGPDPLHPDHREAA